MKYIPICEKAALTLEEAAAYSNIGVNRLRELTESKDCDFVLFAGKKRLIKRRQFDRFLDNTYSV